MTDTAYGPAWAEIRRKQRARSRRQPLKAVVAVIATLVVLGSLSFARSSGLLSPETLQSGQVHARARLQELQRAGASAARAPLTSSLLKFVPFGDPAPSPPPTPILGDGDDDNCTDIQSQPDPCAFVQDECGSVAALIDYLSFHFCTLQAQNNTALSVVSYGMLFLWLAMLLTLTASTADGWFVPALQWLADSLKLHPAVAGITLLAMGNGANDVFTAIAALGADDFPLVLGALVGASMCISAFVLGSVIIVAKNGTHGVDKNAFYRDVLVYICATCVIVAVVADGQISLYESVMFLIIYVLYVSGVVVWTRCVKFDPDAAFRMNKGGNHVRVREDNNNEPVYNYNALHNGHDESVPIATNSPRRGRTISVQSDSSSVAISDVNSDAGDSETDAALEAQQVIAGNVINTNGDDGDKEQQALEDDPEYLVGLHWPGKRASMLRKIQVIAHYPFSVLRWLSIPSSDGKWGPTRRWVAILSPPGFGLVMLVNAYGWDGYSMTVGASGSSNGFPVWALTLIIGCCVSLVTLLTSTALKLPKYYFFFSLLAFVGACSWINLLANEVVAVLQTIGVTWNVSTALLGLTVLAIGNSVNDFVSDTAVARAGAPAIAVATCFGSPLLNDVLGLGISLTITTAQQYPTRFHAKLKETIIIAWGFLGVTLLSSLIIFPAYKFNPPKKYGIYLMILYLCFMVFSCLGETGVI